VRRATSGRAGTDGGPVPGVTDVKWGTQTMQEGERGMPTISESNPAAKLAATQSPSPKWGSGPAAGSAVKAGDDSRRSLSAS